MMLPSGNMPGKVTFSKQAELNPNETNMRLERVEPSPPSPPTQYPDMAVPTHIKLGMQALTINNTTESRLILSVLLV